MRATRGRSSASMRAERVCAAARDPNQIDQGHEAGVGDHCGPEHSPPAGPDAVPATHSLRLRHQPQPATVVHSPHVTDDEQEVGASLVTGPESVEVPESAGAGASGGGPPSARAPVSGTEPASVAGGPASAAGGV